MTLTIKGYGLMSAKITQINDEYHVLLSSNGKLYQGVRIFSSMDEAVDFAKKLVPQNQE